MKKLTIEKYYVFCKKQNLRIINYELNQKFVKRVLETNSDPILGRGAFWQRILQLDLSRDKT